MSEKQKNDIAILGESTRFQSGNKAVEAGRLGGIKSGESRRKNKILKDELMRRLKAKDMKEIAENLIARAKTSDEAFKTLRDTLGQKPADKAEVTADITIVDLLKGTDIEL